jgi:hypothetical protein
VERGVLQVPKRLDFAVVWEGAPVWLLALDAEIVNELWILGHSTPAAFYEGLPGKANYRQLIMAALDNIGSNKIRYTSALGPKPGVVLLVSRSFDYVSRWVSNGPNPVLVLCDHHIGGRHVKATTELCWSTLRHQTFGGTTQFQAVLGTNVSEFQPVRTALRRTIPHVLDYGIKPKWAEAPDSQLLTLSLDDRLHPAHLDSLVLYPTHYSATGWGSRVLSADKIGIAFGLPAWARLASLTVTDIFPFVPIQILDGCLKGILLSSPKTTPLHTPLPQEARGAVNKTWLPRIQRFLPHSWVDANLVTCH